MWVKKLQMLSSCFGEIDFVNLFCFLRSPRAAQRAMKTTKEKDVSAEAVEANGIEKTTIERRVPVQPSIVDDTVHEQKE